MATTGQKYRAQILLEPEQHKKLAEIAAQAGRSVSDVVREAVAEYVVIKTNEGERERRRIALEKIRQHREEMLHENGGKPFEIDVVELINQMREERDNELLTAIEDLARRHS
jgi:predicted transcriptional regulator